MWPRCGEPRAGRPSGEGPAGRAQPGTLRARPLWPAAWAAGGALASVRCACETSTPPSCPDPAGCGYDLAWPASADPTWPPWTAPPPAGSNRSCRSRSCPATRSSASSTTGPAWSSSPSSGAPPGASTRPARPAPAEISGNCERVAFGELEPGLQTGFCCDTGGGWSVAMVAHETQLHPVPDTMSDEAAVLVEPAACAVHTALAGAAGPEDTVVVLGAGRPGTAHRGRPGPPPASGAPRGDRQLPDPKAMGAELGARALDAADPAELHIAAERHSPTEPHPPTAHGHHTPPPSRWWSPPNCAGWPAASPPAWRWAKAPACGSREEPTSSSTASAARPVSPKPWRSSGHGAVSSLGRHARRHDARPHTPVAARGRAGRGLHLRHRDRCPTGRAGAPSTSPSSWSSRDSSSGCLGAPTPSTATRRRHRPRRDRRSPRCGQDRLRPARQERREEPTLMPRPGFVLTVDRSTPPIAVPPRGGVPAREAPARSLADRVPGRTHRGTARTPTARSATPSLDPIDSDPSAGRSCSRA